jgi:polysaccharide chain length determinant protein (PEP-CTERM system associated)
MPASEMTPARLIEIAKRRMWAFIIPALLVVLVVAVIAIALPPIYQSTSTILIEQQDIPPDFIRAAVTTYAEQQLQIINQRVMTTTKLLEIINRFNLYKDLRSSKTTDEIVATMRDDIKLNPVSVDVVDPRTGRPTTATIAFTLSYEGKNNPVQVQQIANILTSLYLDENLKVREQQASNISTFLEDEMQRVKSDLTRIEGRLADFKERHLNTLPEMIQVNMQTLNDIERNRNILNDRMVTLKGQEASIKARLASISPNLREMDRQRLEELKVQLISLRNRFSENYPDVINTKAEIEKLEKSLNAKSKNETSALERTDNPEYVYQSSQLSGIQGEIQTLQSQISELDTQLKDYHARIGATPKVESEYTSLLSEKNNTQAKYDDLMRKLMEAKSSQSLEKGQKGERFTLIEPALLPEKPVKPNRFAIMLIGLVVAAGIGTVTAAAREVMDSSIKNADELASISPNTPLSVIPVIMTAEDLSRIRRKRYIWMTGAGAALMAVIVVFHFFIMRLDLLWTLVMIRLGI